MSINLAEILVPLMGSLPDQDGLTMIAGGGQAALAWLSQRKTAQFEGAMRYEVQLLSQKIEAGRIHLDRNYIRSDAFQTNVIQAFQAAQTAEREEKVSYIARAFLGCSIDHGPININRVLCMRIIEQATYEELEYVLNKMKEGFTSFRETDYAMSNAFLREISPTFQGLLQLGLITQNSAFDGDVFQVSVLAEHVALLCQENQ